ncbi:MFS transporter [Roseibium algae]|uniref:MFS transporter n=1 Tax=Roseibium algae TaxID=3123038 RepID=A0ABU8TK57_9HYPH
MKPSDPMNIALWRDGAAITLLLIATLKIMANATISPALPALEASFATDANAAYLTRFLVSAPSLTVVLVAPFAGIFCDRYGRRGLLLAGLVLFATAGTAGLYLPDLQAIVASRLVLGVAVAMVMTAQVALVGDMYVGARRSGFMGLQVAAINFSGFAYISMAGALATVSPRFPFLIYALPALLLPLVFLTLGARASKGTGGGHGGSGGTISEAGQVVEQASQAAWLLPVLATAALAVLTVMMFFMMPSQVPFYLDESGFDSASATAFVLGALTLTGGVVAMLFSRIKEWCGTPMTFAAGFALMGAGFVLLGTQANWMALLPGAALIGAGYALVQPALLLLALQLAPAHRRGSASGMMTTSLFLGQIISPFALTPFIQASGFASVFLGAAVVLAVLAMSACLVPILRRRSRG